MFKGGKAISSVSSCLLLNHMQIKKPLWLMEWSPVYHWFFQYTNCILHRRVL